MGAIGVNTHVDATTTPYGNIPAVQAALAYLGVGLIRDHAYDIDLPTYQALATSGVRFDLITDSATPGFEVNALAPLGSSIASFEGANEVDLYPVNPTKTRSSVTAAIAEQKSLYAAVKAQPGLSGTPVLNQSVGYPTNYAPFAGALAYSDVANLHAYAGTDAPGPALLQALALEPSNGKQVDLTEAGYSTMPGDPQSVDQLVQAKYTLDLLCDAASLGLGATFLYELVDEAPDPNNTNPQLHYGLFNADFSPKLAAVALHDFTTVLQVPAPSGAAPIALSPTLSGLPDTGNYLQLTGNGGAGLIVAWAEPALWDAAAQQEVAASPSSVVVDLGTTAASVSVYDPLLGTAAIATYANVAAITIALTDHPLVIEANNAAPPVVTPPVVTPPVVDPPVVTPPVVTAPADPVPVLPVTTPATTDPAVVAPAPADPSAVADPAATAPVTTPATTAPISPLTVSTQSVPAIASYASVPVYRFFDTVHGTHFYSTGAAEQASIAASRPDLVGEGIGLTAIDPASGDPAAVPVFRFFSVTNGTHFFTASSSERANLDASRHDLVDEGVGFYEHASPAAGDTAVYRFFDRIDGTHFYTGSATERATVLATRSDLVDEGIGFYAPKG